jgi:hypothetical protein
LPVSQHHGINSIAVGIPVTTIVAMKMKKGIMPIYPPNQG